MDKTKLQQELKEKIKEGIKPSDLKKKGNTNTQIPTPPDSPIITPTDKSLNNKNKSEQQKKLKDLQKDLNFWKNTASNHLKNLQLAQGKIINLEEANKKLKQKPLQLNKEQAKALQEANQKIRDQQKTIQDLDYLLKTGKNSEIISKLETKIKELNKTIEELKNKHENKTNDKEPTNKSFFCDGCQLNKQGTYIIRKVDTPFEPRTHGRTCYLCPSCSPYYKELNDTTFEKDTNPYRIE